MKFSTIFRRARRHFEAGHYVRAKLYHRLCRLVFQCDVPPSASIAEDVLFCHNAFGTVINPSAVVCSGATIQHSVTLGELEDGGAAPMIEPGAYIGARAMVLGGVRVGRNARIGAGSVVLQDVPDGCTAVGVPARVIS